MEPLFSKEKDDIPEYAPWQRSEGIYRQRTEGREKENPALTGYKPAEKEKNTSVQPNEYTRLNNSYGDIAFGFNKKKEMTITVSQQRKYNASQPENDMRAVRGESAVKIPHIRGTFSTNSHSREHSALCYKESADRSAVWVMAQIKEMMQKKRQHAAEEMLPFMRDRQDRLTYTMLEHSYREASEKKDRTAMEAIEREKLTHAQEMSEKKRMERMMFLSIDKTLEKSRKFTEGIVRSYVLPDMEIIEPQDEEDEDEETKNKEQRNKE